MFTLNPCDTNFLPTLEFLLKVVGAIGAFILFWIGLTRYRKDQIWKRNEFLANEIKEFYADKMVQNALLMIDWGVRDIELFPEKENYGERFQLVDRNVLNQALIYHGLRDIGPGKQRFNKIEAIIRDTFDKFLYYLERFEQLMVNGIITEEQLYPYLEYLITDIADERKGLEEETRQTLYNYINEYRFKGVQALFLRYGRDIKPKVESSKIVANRDRK